MFVHNRTSRQDIIIKDRKQKNERNNNNDNKTNYNNRENILRCKLDCRENKNEYVYVYVCLLGCRVNIVHFAQSRKNYSAITKKNNVSLSFFR